jgi:chaperone BCS1
LAVFYLPLSDVQNDADVLGMVARVQPHSMLLLEDIDVVHAAKARDDAQGGVTMSGLLNALDGVSTPNGLITVMTTNDLTALDPAIIRPGRADVREHLGYLDAPQLARLLSKHAGQRVAVSEVVEGLTPADVVEVLKHHLDDPLAGVREVLKMATRRKEAA